MRPREPLAKLIFEAMTQQGLDQADLARMTKLSSQHVSQIVNRRIPYKANRLPNPETLEALTQIPGVTTLDVSRAVRVSAGINGGEKVAEITSGLRRNVHNVVDEFADNQLAGVLQVLLALRDFVRNGKR